MVQGFVNLSLFFLFIFSSSAKANFYNSEVFDKICKTSVFKIENSSYYRLTRQVYAENETHHFYLKKVKDDDGAGTLVLSSDKTNFDVTEDVLRVSDHIRDILVFENGFFVLLNDRVIRLDLQSNQKREVVLPNDGSGKSFDRAYDMTIVGENLMIANGVTGLIAIEPSKMAIKDSINLGLKQSNGHKSVAVSLAVDENQSLYVGISGVTMDFNGTSPMNGIMKVLPSQLTFYPYDQVASGLLSRATKMTLQSGTFWVNNWGILQKIDRDLMEKEGSVVITHIPLFKEEDGIRWHQEILGEMIVTDQALISCTKDRATTAGAKQNLRSSALRLAL